VTKKTAPFVVVWQKAIRDADMPVGRKGFALLLSTWADADGTHCFPSIATLIKLGCAKPTVHRHLATLEADGWLDVRHGGGRRPDRSYEHNVYTLCLPGASGVSDETVPSEGAVSSDTVTSRPAGSLVRRSGVSSETGTVSGETHDQPLATYSVTNPERTSPVRGDSGMGKLLALTPGKLAAKASEAGLDAETLRALVFATTSKTRVEILKTADETERVARAIDEIVASCEETP